MFSAYYRPSKSEFTSLWNTCFFAFDANVLLDFYRYTPETQRSMFRILDRLKSRLWIPHQAAFEFHKNRLQVISDMQKPYQTAKKIVADLTAKAGEELSKLPSKHPFIRIDEIKAHFENAEKSINTSLDEFASKHPNILDDPDTDEIRDHISALFDGAVGAPYEEKRVHELCADFKRRYERRIPPGYMDLKEKDALDAYGDAILFSALNLAKKSEKPCVFVTADSKEDWWLIVCANGFP